VYSICATKKLLDRIPGSVEAITPAPSTLLGNWYATAIFGRPHVALLVNERTLLPVLMPLAPAKTLSERFPAALAEVLAALEVDSAFIANEIARMTEPVFSKTANRSVVGTLTEFCFLSEVDHPTYAISTQLDLSLWLARVPCGALRKSHDFPDRELFALLKSLGVSHGLNPTHRMGKSPSSPSAASSIPSYGVFQQGATILNFEPRQPPLTTGVHLRVSLRDSDPLIWRQLRVPVSIPLEKLHEVIQTSMGWENRHLHSFEIGDMQYGPLLADLEDEEQDMNERGVPLHEFLGSSNRFTYEYDFGDSWIHDIEVEGTDEGIASLRLAVCLEGARACPPEDCGGISRFAELLRVIADPMHKGHRDYVEWFGDFDPDTFELATVNARLRRIH
jgi:hypothetical protein